MNADIGGSKIIPHFSGAHRGRKFRFHQDIYSGPNYPYLRPVHRWGDERGRIASGVGKNGGQRHRGAARAGLKDRPKRAMMAYYDDVLGNVENR